MLNESETTDFLVRRMLRHEFLKTGVIGLKDDGEMSLEIFQNVISPKGISGPGMRYDDWAKKAVKIQIFKKNSTDT